MTPACALNALSAGRISAPAYATLAGVTSFVRADRTAFVYRRTIAARMNATVRTIGRHLAELTEAGLLQVTANPWGGPSLYALVDPCGKCFAKRSDQETPMTPPEDKFVPHKGTTSVSLDRSEETEVDSRIEAQVKGAIDRGDVTNVAAYRRRAMSNEDDRARHRADIRRERRTAELTAAIADCDRCDSAGWVDIDEDTRARCRLHFDPDPPPTEPVAMSLPGLFEFPPEKPPRELAPSVIVDEIRTGGLT